MIASMNDSRFDSMVRSIGGATNRRGLLRKAAVMAAAMVGMRVVRTDAHPLKPRVFCHATGSVTHPWELVTIPVQAKDTHLVHGDVLFHDCCDDTYCNSNRPHCRSGVCSECLTAAECVSNDPCFTAVCDSGFCALNDVLDGEQGGCPAGQACQAGHCTSNSGVCEPVCDNDDVCVDQICKRPCGLCKAPSVCGSDGYCTNYPCGSDDDCIVEPYTVCYDFGFCDAPPIPK